MCCNFKQEAWKSIGFSPLGGYCYLVISGRCAKILRRLRVWNVLVMTSSPLYKVIFLNQDKTFEIFAKQIFQSDLYGFIEVEEIVFGERSQLLLDPSEEKLKTEFESVTRSYIPVHAIVRIDEVEKGGVAKIIDTGVSNVTRMPGVPVQPSEN